MCFVWLEEAFSGARSVRVDTIPSPSGRRSEGIFVTFSRIVARSFAENGRKWVVWAWGIIPNEFWAELLIFGPILKIVELC